MRNNENGNSRSGRSAAAVRLVLLALIFVTVFAVVLSCGTGTETPLFGSVTDNVAEAAHSGGDGNQVTSYSGSSTTIASLQEQIHDSTIGSASITTNLSNVTFSDSTVSYYKTGGTSEGIVFWNGGTASSWGTNAAGQHWMFSPEVIVVVNIKVPDSVMAFVNAGYTVTVSYSAMVYTSYDNNQTNGTYMALTSSKVAASNFLDGDAWKKSGWTTFDGGPTGGTSRNFGTLTITGGNSNLVLGLARNSGWYQTPGIRAASHNLTFNISRGSLTDSTRPSISSAAAEDGPQLKTSGGASVTSSYLGSNSGLSPNTTNITLGKAVSQATFSANGQKYYKKLTLTVRDGDPNSAAFYYGVRDLNITEAPGGVDGAWVHVGNLPQGNKENETTTASGTNYYITASNTTNAGSQATFTLYFKANGTYTIKFEDNASAFGGTNAACDPITIKVSGIDTTAPTAEGLLDGSPTAGVFKDTTFDESTWASVGSVSQNLKGMNAAADLASGNSAWAFFFDIAYSFYAPTAEWAKSTLAGVNASNIDKINGGTAAPFKVVNGTTTANFSYNFKEGTASNGSPLSGGNLTEVSPTRAGYYMIMVYIADVAGNVCATPFTYFVRVDNTTVTDTPLGEYSYLDKAGETQKVTSDQWINKYMIGDSARIDISFILNPAGNVVNFNFSSFAGTSTDNFANNSATVQPGTTADGEKLTVTIGDIEFATDTEGATLIIGEGLGAELSALGANLSAEIKVEVEDDNTRKATLSLIYTRVDGEFGVNSEPGVTVRSALGTATVYASGIVPVRIDTVSVNDLELGTADGGNYLVANGGNDTTNGSNGGYPENSISIDISTVEGRVWYTDENNAISVSTDRFTGDALLDAMLGAYAGNVYFGWKVYSDASAAGTTEGETVTPGAINSDYDAFKAAMDAVIGEDGTYTPGGPASAFTKFFAGNSVIVEGEVNNILGGGGTLDGLAGADAGVRVLYVMTLDQAGNANFELYYVFVDTKTYTIKFETDGTYADYFAGLGDSALRDIQYETTLRGDGVDGTYAATFKRGQNIVVTVGTGTPGGDFKPGFPGGFVPYEVYKYTEGSGAKLLIYSHTKGGATGTEPNFVFDRLEGITTSGSGSDVAGGSYIAFVLDQAGNIGSLGNDLGLMFSYRKLVSTSVLNTKVYDGKAADGMVSVKTDANVTDTLASHALDDINSVIKWEGTEDAPVNAGSYQYSFDLNNAAEKYFIAEKVNAARYEITKRNIDLLAAIGGADKWQNAIYGDVYDRDYITQYLGAGALSGVTLETALGSSDLGQDAGKTLGDITNVSGLVLANGKALSELVYSAGGGNLPVGSYALTDSSGVTATNYTFSLSVSFEIAKAPLTVTLKGSKTYAQPDSDAAVTLQIGSDDEMKGDSLTDIFGSSVDVNNATSRIINITSGYTYEGQGQYATAGEHKFTGVTYAGLSGNFDMKLSDTPGNMTVNKLTVYAIPDSGQTIYSPQTYTINFNYYYTASNSGTQVTDATVRGEITAGTFVLAEEPSASHGESYTVKVDTAFTATNNITIETVVDGITVTLEYDWSRNTLTISFVTVPTATYRVQFGAPTELGAYSFEVTNDSGERVDGITVTSLGTPYLNGYAVTNAANSTFTVEFPNLVIDGADKGDLNIVFNTQVTIGYLNVTLTPSFSETEKTYGDPDDWTGKFKVTPSTDAAIGDFDLGALKYTGALGRALYKAGVFVRAGAANDDVNAMLAEGEYYAAYVSERYSVNDPSIRVTVDEAALKDIRFTVNAREIEIGTYGKDKEVPDGTANVPYADGEKAVFINNLVGDDEAFLTWTSAVYVLQNGDPVTGDLNTGGQTGLYILVSGIAWGGADKLNYKLTVEEIQFGGGYRIVEFHFEALKSGDIVITKVYDATTKIVPETHITIEQNGNAFNLLEQYGYTVEFYGFNVAHGNVDLSDTGVGNYTVRPTFFVAGLPETSFAEGGELWVVERTEYGVGGVLITVNNVLATITPLPISFDMLKVTVETERPYDATMDVTRTIDWNTEAEGYNPAIHTRDNLAGLRLRATITLADPDAGEGKAVSFSDLTYATSGSNLTVDENFEDEAKAHFTGLTVTVTPVDITVNFAFEDGVYGDAAPKFDRNRTTYDVATPFEAWEDQRGYFNLNVDDATVIYSDASGKEYLYVQYDADGNVRLHDVHYEKVRITANAEFVNLKNYTIGGVALDSADATDGFSGTLEAAAVLNPKPLEYDTSGLAGATKVYDGTTNAAPALEALIGAGDINVFFGEGGVLDGDLTLVKIAYTATYRDAQAGTGNTITVSGIKIVANGDSENAKAAAGSYSIPVSNKLIVENATITKAPLLVTFRLPEKDWDGTVFVSESEITYVLGALLDGGDYDFAIEEDRSKYSVTFTAGGYSDPNVAETVSGTVYNVVLKNNSGNVNYYLVESSGNALSTGDYSTGVDDPSGTAVAKYADGYVFAGGGNKWTTAPATGRINKATVTITIEVTSGAITKVYDGTDTLDLDPNAYTIKLNSGTITDEELIQEIIGKVKVGSVRFDAAVAGDREAVFTIVYTGDEASNYTVASEARVPATITKSTITVSVGENTNFTYGEKPDYSGQLVYTGEFGDTVTIDGGKIMIDGVDHGDVSEISLVSNAFVLVSGRYADAGTYDVTGVNGTATNFVFVIAEGQTVVIDKATLTVNAAGCEYFSGSDIDELRAKVEQDFEFIGLVAQDDNTGVTITGDIAEIVKFVKDGSVELAANAAPGAEYQITLDLTKATSTNYVFEAGSVGVVTVVLPAFNAAAVSGIGVVYDGTDKLAGEGSAELLDSLVTYNVQTGKTYEIALADDTTQAINAGSYDFDVVVTVIHSDLEGYASGNEAYEKSAIVHVTLTVGKAPLTVSRGEGITVAYNGSAQKLTEYEGFFVFDGAVEAEKDDMLAAIGATYTLSGTTDAKDTFTGAGVYSVVLVTDAPVFGNYTVTSRVTTLNVGKAPVIVLGTKLEGDITSGDEFGIVELSVEPADGCAVPEDTVKKLTASVTYVSGSASVGTITSAGRYNYTVALSDPANYQIVSTENSALGTVGATGTITVSVSIVQTGTGEGEQFVQQAEIVFGTPEIKAWVLTATELTGGTTYNNYESIVSRTVSLGQQAEIDGVISLTLTNGTEVINASSVAGLSSVSEITVKLPAAVGSSLEGYTVYERQKDGSLKAIEGVVNDGYFTYNSGIVSDLVF
ncbi:MAG TPA: hypothetical protein IAC73_06465, partial [Candidatus Limadaptatus stercoripullorum]|nr:hypothetical protein [Candidatus Limadaptatus stercoripullorum]